MKRKHITIIVAVVFISLLLNAALTSNTVQAAEKKVDVVKQVNKLLKKIKKYDWGDSRENLTKLTAVLREGNPSQQELLKVEQSFIKFLNSKATLASKQFICKRLSLIGTEASVPTLSRMLLDEKTSDMARYALERIPGEKVNTALRDALVKTSGKLRIGIINTLGMRQDAQAVPLLKDFVYDKDQETAKAAIAALGHIANNEALAILSEALVKACPCIRLSIYDALLKCADKLVDRGETVKAISIYKQVDGPDAPFSVRAASIKGRFYADKEHAAQLLCMVIKNGDFEAQKVAFELLRELPQKDRLPHIAKQFPNLSPAARVQLITALGDIGDPSVKDVVVKATKCKYDQVRIAALKALANLGDAGTVNLLAEAAVKSSGAERKAAEESLALLRGDDINAAILEALPKADTKTKIVLLTALGARDAKETVPTLLETAKDKDAKVRRVALKVLGQLAQPDVLPQLVDLLINAQAQAERNEAISSVVAVAHKISDPSKQAEYILKKLPQVEKTTAKLSLLRVLGKIGDENALPVLRNALKDQNEEIQAEAIRALSDWPTDKPMGDLLAIAKNPKNPDHQALALSGYIRLVRIGKRPEEKTVQMYVQAMNLAKDVAEKRQVLSGMGELGSVTALKTAQQYLQEKDIQPEAEIAVYKIARRVRRDHPKEAKKALKKVLAITQNESLKNDVKRELDRIK